MTQYNIESLFSFRVVQREGQGDIQSKHLFVIDTVVKI